MSQKLIRHAAIALALCAMLHPIAALANCRASSGPSYDDVDAILISQTGCGSTQAPGEPSSLACSKFWLMFSDYAVSTYSQYNLPGSVGTYKVAATIDQARMVLRHYAFFSLAPDAQRPPTDVASWSIWVQYCAVTRSVKVFDWPLGAESAMREMASAFRDILTHSARRQVSTSPQIYTPLFDPW